MLYNHRIITERPGFSHYNWYKLYFRLQNILVDITQYISFISFNSFNSFISRHSYSVYVSVDSPLIKANGNVRRNGNASNIFVCIHILFYYIRWRDDFYCNFLLRVRRYFHRKYFRFIFLFFFRRRSTCSAFLQIVNINFSFYSLMYYVGMYIKIKPTLILGIFDSFLMIAKKRWSVANDPSKLLSKVPRRNTLSSRFFDVSGRILCNIRVTDGGTAVDLPFVVNSFPFSF